MNMVVLRQMTGGHRVVLTVSARHYILSSSTRTVHSHVRENFFPSRTTG
jgi:hypothetical protein